MQIEIFFILFLHTHSRQTCQVCWCGTYLEHPLGGAWNISTMVRPSRWGRKVSRTTTFSHWSPTQSHSVSSTSDINASSPGAGQCTVQYEPGTGKYTGQRIWGHMRVTCTTWRICLWVLITCSHAVWAQPATSPVPKHVLTINTTA